MKYKYIGSFPVILPTLGIGLAPGQTFDSDVPINNVNIVEVTEPAAPAAKNKAASKSTIIAAQPAEAPMESVSEDNEKGADE